MKRELHSLTCRSATCVLMRRIHHFAVLAATGSAFFFSPLCADAQDSDRDKQVRIGSRYVTCERLEERIRDPRREDRAEELRKSARVIQESASQLTDAANQFDNLANWTSRLDYAREVLDTFSSVAGHFADMGTGFSVASSAAFKVLEEGYRVTGEDIDAARREARAGASKFSRYAGDLYDEANEIADAVESEKTAYQNNCAR